MRVIHPRPLLPETPTRSDRPYVALNMIATVDGRAVVNGSTAGLGSTADQRLMRELRAEADVVLHGAGTVRAEPTLTPRVPADLVDVRLAHGLSPQPPGVIITASGNLPANLPYYDSATIIYVLSEHDVPVDRPTVEVCHVGSVAEALADLGRRGVRRVLSEGGPVLNAGMFAAGLIDEMFLTIAPRLVGGPQPQTIIAGAALGTIRLELRSLVEIDGEVFVKYGVLI